jgi:hypothetical protein
MTTFTNPVFESVKQWVKPENSNTALKDYCYKMKKINFGN